MYSQYVPSSVPTPPPSDGDDDVPDDDNGQADPNDPGYERTLSSFIGTERFTLSIIYLMIDRCRWQD
jgi:hypothetical protein